MLYIGLATFLALFCFFLYYWLREKERKSAFRQMISQGGHHEEPSGNRSLFRVSGMLKKSLSFLFPVGDKREELEQNLRYAGVKYSPEDWVTIRLLVFLGLFFLVMLLESFSVKGVMEGLGLGAVSYLLVNERLKEMVRKREQAINDEIVIFIEAVYSSIRSGLTLPSAIREAANRSEGVLAEIMRQAVYRMDSGYPFRESMLQVKKESPSRYLRMFVDTLTQAQKYGAEAETGRIMKDQLQRIRHDIESEGITKAQKAGASVTIPNILFIAFPTLLVMILPALFRPLF